MRTLLFFLVLLSALSYKKYGVHIWRGNRKSRSKFELQVSKHINFDLLNVIENECDKCNFEGVLVDTKKNDRVLFEYTSSEGMIRVYVNEEFKTESSNTGKCFSCIERQCK